MPFRNHIPNFITLLNLASGLIALVFAFETNLQMAFFWVCAGIFFDFWDGFFARILNASRSLIDTIYLIFLRTSKRAQSPSQNFSLRLLKKKKSNRWVKDCSGMTYC